MAIIAMNRPKWEEPNSWRNGFLERADLLAEADRFGVPRKQKLFGDVRSTLDNGAEHTKAAGLSQGKTDELGRDFLLL
jgi:hypothetical protein